MAEAPAGKTTILVSIDQETAANSENFSRQLGECLQKSGC
jgi:hypothetical protein